MSSRALVRRVTEDERRATRRRMYMQRRPRVTAVRNVPSVRIPRSLTSGATIYPFRRSTRLNFTMNPSSGITAGALSGFGLGLAFSLSNVTYNLGGTSASVAVPSTAEFTALFDQWRIHKVVCRYVYSNNTSSTASGTTFLPNIYVCNDQDDGGAPAAITDLQQRPEAKLVQLGTNGYHDNIRNFVVYPQASLVAYQGITPAYSLANRKTYVDVNSADTYFFGQKMWWDAERATNQDVGNLLIYVDIYYEFRGVR